jgi:hypothetical protein
MSINIAALPQTKPSFMFGKVKDTTILNTDIKRLPEEKVPLAIVSAVEKLMKAKENKASGSLMNVEEMPAENVYHSTTNMPSVKVQSTKPILQNANKTVKEELDEIAKILQDAIFLAHAENSSLGDIKAPEFNELKALNMIVSGMIVSGMIVNFSSSTMGELISQKNKADARLESIKLFCQGKNLQPKALNIIQDCTQKVVFIKGREECNTLANENFIHQKEFQKRYPAKKGFSR